MKNYLPAGARENRVEVIVQKRFQQHRQSTVLGQIIHLHRIQPVIDPVVPAETAKRNSMRTERKDGGSRTPVVVVPGSDSRNDFRREPRRGIENEDGT